MKKILDDLRGRLDRHIEAGRAWINEQLLPRYQQLAPREQRLVLVTAILLPLLVLVFGIVLPMQDHQRALREDIRVLQHQAEEASGLAKMLQKQGPAHQVGNGDVMATVEQLVTQEKVLQYMTDIHPQASGQGDDAQQRVMVQLKDAPYTATLHFIAALAHASLGVKSMRLQEGSSPGHVHMQVVISNG